MATARPAAARRSATVACRRFARKEVDFHEGDPGDTLHLVRRGHVAARITTPLGEVATLTVVSPGQTFGELALLADTARRSATCIALEPTETWALHRDQIDRPRSENAAVDRFLVSLLAGDVRRLSEHLVQALCLQADQRVALRVLDLADTYADGVPIPITQDDIAAARDVLQQGEPDGRDGEHDAVIPFAPGSVLSDRGLLAEQVPAAARRRLARRPRGLQALRCGSGTARRDGAAPADPAFRRPARRGT